MTENKLKDFYCSTPNCRAVLGQTDGEKFFVENPEVVSRKLSGAKKECNIFYCVKCHQITRYYKTRQKFARIKKG